MSEYTPNLNLFKYNTSTDGKEVFSIAQALNHNWDILDNMDLLPDQTDKAGYLLTTNGTEASWGETQEVQCVVETYQNGTSWYRVYSDGWCEQGGAWGSNVSSWTSASVTYLKPYKNTNYQLYVQGNWSDAQSSSCKVTVRSTTGFTGEYANNLYSTMPSYWYTCGYIEV